MSALGKAGADPAGARPARGKAVERAAWKRVSREAATAPNIVAPAQVSYWH